jgi:hypothetical protein
MLPYFRNQMPVAFAKGRTANALRNGLLVEFDALAIQHES